MRAIAFWLDPTLRTARACTGLWVRGTTVAGLAAGLAGTVAASAALHNCARWFDHGAIRRG